MPPLTAGGQIDADLHNMHTVSEWLVPTRFCSAIRTSAGPVCIRASTSFATHLATWVPRACTPLDLLPPPFPDAGPLPPCALRLHSRPSSVPPAAPSRSHTAMTSISSSSQTRCVHPQGGPLSPAVLCAPILCGLCRRIGVWVRTERVGRAHHWSGCPVWEGQQVYAC